MTNEEKILERLERLEQKIDPIAASSASVKSLTSEMAPRVNEAVHYLIAELADIEADFQIEDLIYFTKKLLRNINNLNYSLDMLKNVIDFSVMAEPLLKSTVPEAISVLDDLEQANVFQVADVSVQALKKIGQTYTKEELSQMADGVVRLTGLLKEVTRPESLDFLERAVRVPAAVDVDAAGSVGMFSMLGAMSDEKVKEGMGVLMELTKGLAALKGPADKAN